ncbi:unnamed protein product, partial [Adineta ricciae]
PGPNQPHSTFTPNEDAERNQGNLTSSNTELYEPNARKIHITDQTLHYAIEQHLPPIKVICEPKIKHENEAKSLLKELLSKINQKFIELNPKYSQPVAFDYWYIDREGNLSCFTKKIELFVFLCDGSNYPNRISNTCVHPVPPKRLPPQCSVILKFVPNNITTEELEEE